jgi:hypothetical protein
MTRDEIIACHPIVEFVRSRGHELKPAGKNFVTSGCPMTEHRRGHRPVTIDVAKEVWHCNDCDVGGSVIDWVKHEKGMSDAEAFKSFGRGRNSKVRKHRGKIVTAYDYQDANGKLRFQVVRTTSKDKPKGFSQRQPNCKGEWIWNLTGVERVLYRLPEIIRDARDGLTIYVCEGEKDVLKMVEHGFSATTNSGGKMKWRDSYSETLRDVDVVIIADKDTGGREHAQDVASKLHGIAKFVRVIELPDLSAKKVKDPHDFFTAGGTAQELQRIADDAPEWKPDDQSSADDATVAERLKSKLPKVRLPGDRHLLSTFAAECADVLKGCGIYRHGGLAFIVNENRDGLDLLTPQTMRTLAEKYLVCFKVRQSTHAGYVVHVAKTMTTDDALGVLNSPQFLEQLPKVVRIATTRLPVMRADAKIELLSSGYDKESQTLTLPHCDYDTAIPFRQAKEIIDNLLSEFPFADKGRSKAVATSGIAGLYVAGLFRTGITRPVLIYIGNAEGAGKTLLAKCAISPTHGLVRTDGDLRDKEETAKELLAAVMEARPYIFFDNCKRHLDSPHLEALVSATMFHGRILGMSKTFAGENLMTVFVTGNGCTISPDMRRRSLIVELFMEDERAEDRKFERVLDDAALLDLRPQILAALWALVREWDKAGRPKPRRSHTAFPRWANIVGGIVEHAGYSCPLETVEIQRAADMDGNDMHELAERLTEEPVKFDEIVALCREHGLFERILGSDEDLKPSDKSRFGKLLTRYDRRRFSGSRRFVVEGKGHYRTFRIQICE